MPTYEYECKAGHRFEKFQSMTAKPLRKCVKCGKAVRRLMGGGAGVLFKGSGFYQTDYRSKSYQESAKKESSNKDASSSSTSSEASSKPKNSPGRQKEKS